MSGERQLQRLLSSISPELLPGEFVFCSLAQADYAELAQLSPLAFFKEREGLSLVLPRARADAAGLDYSAVQCCISLGVHSSLDAVGLTAAIATRLAEADISANVIAAYYHDHVFVPARRADEALVILRALGE